jgi:cytochrome c556
MRHTFVSATLALSLTALLPAAHAADARQLVKMPAPMQEHMLANMRDHLVAMGEVQAALGKGDFDRAADIAEQRIGMSSLLAHDASHMAPYMPKGMQDIGTTMHRTASRFARTTQEAAVTNDMPRALGALSELTQQCAACHAGYRLR